MSDYLAKRWKAFMMEMYNSVVNNTEFIEKDVMNRVFEKVEMPFTLQNNTFSTVPTGLN